MDRGVEAKLVNIKESDIWGGDGPGISNRTATSEELMEKKENMGKGKQQEDIINKPWVKGLPISEIPPPPHFPWRD